MKLTTMMMFCCSNKLSIIISLKSWCLPSLSLVMIMKPLMFSLFQFIILREFLRIWSKQQLEFLFESRQTRLWSSSRHAFTFLFLLSRALIFTSSSTVVVVTSHPSFTSISFQFLVWSRTRSVKWKGNMMIIQMWHSSHLQINYSKRPVTRCLPRGITRWIVWVIYEFSFSFKLSQKQQVVANITC